MTWKLQSLAFQCSHLFQRVASFLLRYPAECPVGYHLFSSLSESGFIPTTLEFFISGLKEAGVLISFREWLHSYSRRFLGFRVRPESPVLISFREWLHSYLTLILRFCTRLQKLFSSLSESGFIPTLGFHDCLSMRLLEREKGNLRNLVLV